MGFGITRSIIAKFSGYLGRILKLYSDLLKNKKFKMNVRNTLQLHSYLAFDYCHSREGGNLVFI